MLFFEETAAGFFFAPQRLLTSPWANETAYGLLGNPLMLDLLERSLRRLAPCMCCYYTADKKLCAYVDCELANYKKHYSHPAYLQSQRCADIKAALASRHSALPVPPRPTDYKHLCKKDKERARAVISAGVPLFMCARRGTAWLLGGRGVPKFVRKINRTSPVRVRRPTFAEMATHRHIGYTYVLETDVSAFLETAAGLTADARLPGTADK